MITPPRRKPRRGRVRSAAFLRFVRSLPCVLCQRKRHSRGFEIYNMSAGSRWLNWASGQYTEAAHVGNRGLGQKCSDRETIPLCAAHHRTGKDSHHVLGKKFWDFHGLDKEKLIAELNARYEEERAAA